MSQFRTAGSVTTYSNPAKIVFSVPVRNDCQRVPILFAITAMIIAAIIALFLQRSFAMLRMTAVIAALLSFRSYCRLPTASISHRRHIIRPHFCWRVLAHEHELELLEDFHRRDEVSTPAPEQASHQRTMYRVREARRRQHAPKCDIPPLFQSSCRQCGRGDSRSAP